jgi:O-antigen/teichoic acid export membrane protein
VLKRVIAASTGAYAEYAAGMLASVLLVRSLMPAHYGEYSFVIWLAGWLIVASVGAVPLALIKFLPEHLSSPTGLVSASWYWQRLQRIFALQLITACIGLFFFVIFSERKADHLEPWALFFVVLFSVACRSAYRLIAALAQANERFGLEAKAISLASFLNLGLIACAFVYLPKVEVFLGIYVFSSALQLGLILWFVSRAGIVPKAVVQGQIDYQRNLKDFLPIASLLVFVALLGNRAIEMFLLKAYDSSESVAFYSVGITLSRAAVDILTVGLTNALAPAVSRYVSNLDSEPVFVMIRKYTRLYLILAVFSITVSIVAMGPAVLTLFGNAYVEATHTATWLVAAAAIVIVPTPIIIAQTMQRRQHARLVCFSISTGTNMLAGFTLIPTYGLNGALATTLITSICGVLAMFAVSGKQFRLRLDLWLCLRLLACATLVVAVMSMAQLEAPPFVELIIFGFGGAVSFIILCTVARCFSEHELRFIVDRLGRSNLRLLSPLINWFETKLTLVAYRGD